MDNGRKTGSASHRVGVLLEQTIGLCGFAAALSGLARLVLMMDAHGLQSRFL